MVRGKGRVGRVLGPVTGPVQSAACEIVRRIA
jgi:hypothetical protein